MKKPVLFLVLICVFYGAPLTAQTGKFLNKISKSVTRSITGTPGSDNKDSKEEPEPKCACEQPELVLDLGGNLKLMYSEISLTVREDGAILIKDRMSDDFYIAKDGTAQGPIKAGDKKLAGFEGLSSADAPEATTAWLNNDYISSSGDKFLIKFNGKTYGPYGQIREFKVARSKDKFAAIVIENVVVNEADGKKMDEAIKNAKTEQEKRDLAMQYTQQMMNKVQQGGGPMSTMPKLITNIPGVTFDPVRSVGGTLNSNIKFDDILFKTSDKVIDLSNRVLLTLKPEAQNSESLFVNTDNTKYAYYKYGTLTFSDEKVISELFNPHLIKDDGKIFLAYMYYSPKKNSIMQCKIPF